MHPLILLGNIQSFSFTTQGILKHGHGASMKHTTRPKLLWFASMVIEAGCTETEVHRDKCIAQLYASTVLVLVGTISFGKHHSWTSDRHIKPTRQTLHITFNMSTVMFLLWKYFNLFNSINPNFGSMDEWMFMNSTRKYIVMSAVGRYCWK